MRLGAVLGACGGSTGGAAPDLATSIEQELRAQGLVASVVCPADAPIRPGGSVTCTAMAVDDPDRVALTVRAEISRDSGRVVIRPEAALAIARAGPAIGRALAERGIEARRIDCDDTIARPGDPLRCEIEASEGRMFSWQAVIGPDGHARGELVPR